MIAFTIQNTSKTSILLSTITFKLETDKNEYLQTVTSNIKIIPNGMIALSAIVAYIDNTEEYVDIVIVNTFFD